MLLDDQHLKENCSDNYWKTKNVKVGNTDQGTKRLYCQKLSVENSSVEETCKIPFNTLHSEHTALLKLEIGIQQNQSFVHNIICT